ncbi:MAG: hypothetical protein NZN45_08655 [Rhodovarius sp.]|nr:hypothetical protein [Rhodovarius sp.]
MRHMGLALIAGLALLALAAGPAAAQQGGLKPGAGQGTPSPAGRGIEIVNRSDTTLREAYLFLPGAPEGPDRLGASVVPSGGSFVIRLPPGGPCELILRAVFSDESEESLRVNACTGQRVVLTDANRRELLLVNDTEATLLQLFVFPRGADDPGPDRLGRATLAPGEEFRLRLRGLTACAVTVRASFDGQPAQRQDLDICAHPRIAFGDPSVPLREVRLINRRLVAMTALQTSPDPAAPWGPDRLGRRVLDGGDSLLLRIRSAACRVRMRALFEDRLEEVREEVDLCSGEPVVFLPMRRIAVGSLYDRPIVEMYLSPVTDRDWGPNQIERPISRGGRAELATDGDCRADLRIVFDNGSAEELRNFDICRHQAITLRPGWVTEERE